MQVRIKQTIVTTQYGTLSEGTLLRTSEGFANHLVNEIGCAEYTATAPEVKALEVTASEITPEAEPKKRGRPAKKE